MRIGARGWAIGGAAIMLATAILLASRVVAPPSPPDLPAKDPPMAVADPGPWQDITWERIGAPSLGGPLNQSPVAIFRGGPGFIVVGRDADGAPGAERQVGTVWTSTDARSWVKRRITEGIPRGDLAEIRLAASGAAGVLIVGGVCCSIEDPAMWLVTDDDIERVILPEGMRSVTVLDVEAGPNGYVAGGVRSDGDPVDPRFAGSLWHSPDGRRWTAVDPVAAKLGPGGVQDVLWTGQAWLAVGARDEDGRSDGAVWQSDDGVGWAPVAVDDAAIAGPEEEALTRLLPIDGGLFAQGGSGTHQDRLDCEGLLGEGVVGVPDAVLSLSCGWGVTTHWLSPDGLAWQRAPALEGPFPGQPVPVAPGGRQLISHRVLEAGGPGLVVVDAEEPRRADGSDSVGTWISDDGASWRPVGAPDQFPDRLFLQDMVVAGRMVVGVGDSDWDQPDGTDVIVWIGTFMP